MLFNDYKCVTNTVKSRLLVCMHAHLVLLSTGGVHSVAWVRRARLISQVGAFFCTHTRTCTCTGTHNNTYMHLQNTMSKRRARTHTNTHTRTHTSTGDYERSSEQEEGGEARGVFGAAGEEFVFMSVFLVLCMCCGAVEECVGLCMSVSAIHLLHTLWLVYTCAKRAHTNTHAGGVQGVFSRQGKGKGTGKQGKQNARTHSNTQSISTTHAGGVQGVFSRGKGKGGGKRSREGSVKQEGGVKKEETKAGRGGTAAERSGVPVKQAPRPVVEHFSRVSVCDL